MCLCCHAVIVKCSGQWDSPVSSGPFGVIMLRTRCAVYVRHGRYAQLEWLIMSILLGTRTVWNVRISWMHPHTASCFPHNVRMCLQKVYRSWHIHLSNKKMHMINMICFLYKLYIYIYIIFFFILYYIIHPFIMYVYNGYLTDIYKYKYRYRYRYIWKHCISKNLAKPLWNITFI